MRFVIESVTKVNVADKYVVSGYLKADENDKDTLRGMAEELNNFLSMDNSLDVSDTIIIDSNRIIYNSIPMITCSNMLKIFRNNLGVDIITEISPLCNFKPSSCAQLFKMEVLRLFN